MRDRQRAFALLLAVFLLGGIAGFGALHLWSGARASAHSDRQQHRRGPKLSSELGLSKDQEKQFKEIMAESRQQYEAVRKEIAPKFQAVKTETDKKVFSILNQEQKVKFAEVLKRMDKEMENRRKRAGEKKW